MAVVETKVRPVYVQEIIKVGLAGTAQCMCKLCEIVNFVKLLNFELLPFGLCIMEFNAVYFALCPNAHLVYPESFKFVSIVVFVLQHKIACRK